MIYQQTITLQRQKKAQVGLDLLNTRTALMLLMYLSVNFSNLWESTGRFKHHSSQGYSLKCFDDGECSVTCPQPPISV